MGRTKDLCCGFLQNRCGLIRMCPGSDRMKAQKSSNFSSMGKLLAENMAIVNEPSTPFSRIRTIAFLRLLFERPQKNRFGIASGMSLHVRMYRLESREVSNGSGLQIREIYVVARMTPQDFAIDPPHNQEAFTRPAHAKVHRRRVIYLVTFCVCLSAVAATFTLVVFESSQAGSASITFSSFRAVLLAVFSAPLVTDVCVTTMVIFRILRVGLTDSQLTPRARWDSYRGAIVNVIEGCVVFPVLLLNIINACSQYYGSQNALDYITQVATIVLFFAWIAIWIGAFCSSMLTATELESTTLQSRGNHHHLGAGEANRREFREEPPDTFDSLTYSDTIEMAVPTLVVD